MRRTIASLVAGFAFVAALPTTAPAQQGSRFHPGVTGRDGVVATESPAAARVGRAVLEHGGNAIDAAAATVFALNVARPQSCGIGGGGFMVLRLHDGRVRTLDFRETAPAAMRPDTFSGNGIYKQFTGHTTIGVPGVVAGMDAALARYGTLSLRQAIAPAERLARTGVRVTSTLARTVADNQARVARYGAAKAIFLPGGRPLTAGQTLVQPELAASLRRIMRGGPAAFYRGTIARRIALDSQGANDTAEGDVGLLTRADLARYRAVWRAPVLGTFRGASIAAMGPPTSGGVVLLEMLNLLQPLDLRARGFASADTLHLIGEAQKIAWADRNAYLADPAFVPQPTTTLTARSYADRRRAEISLARAGTYKPGDVSSPAARAAGRDLNPNGSTTQVSIIDARGNAVALTCTIEQEMGSGVVAPGTGFLLNNEMTDFSAPGTANEPRPFKRPRSSMSPTIVSRAGKPVLVAGGAGGSLIIMGVVQAVLDTQEFGMDLPHAVDAPRVDDQGTSTMSVEDARIAPAALDTLISRGWRLTRLGEYGPRPRVQSAGETASGAMTAVSDSRSDQGSLAARRRARPARARR